MVKSRAFKALNIIEKLGLDALLFTSMPNIRYFSGFTGTDAMLLVTASGSWFLTDSRYTTQAAEETAMEVRLYAAKTEGVTRLLAEQNCRRVGFEGSQLSYHFYHELVKSTESVTWVSVTETDALRACKDTEELACISRAADYNAAALQAISPLIKCDALESDIALELEFALRKLGGEDKAFDFIVASGARGALPHGVASGKKLSAGELLTIDFGTRYRGYHSDETVTMALGPVSDELKCLHDIVLEAHDRAIEAVQPGCPLREIDAAARNFIVDKGYGDYFGHGLGHGVGLEIHEWPRVSPKSESVAEVGMVFTIEPGIYLPEKGGVRIEDIVAVTEQGCRILTKVPKSFTVLPN